MRISFFIILQLFVFIYISILYMHFKAQIACARKKQNNEKKTKRTNFFLLFGSRQSLFLAPSRAPGAIANVAATGPAALAALRTEPPPGLPSRGGGQLCRNRPATCRKGAARGKKRTQVLRKPSQSPLT
jgi:hypothetical protein